MFTRLMTLAAVLSIAPAFGQSVKFEVPFDFTAGSQIWKAGIYNVAVVAPNVVRIRNEDTNRSGALLTNRATSRLQDGGKAELMFHRYGDRYFLEQFSVGPDVGQALLETPAEREHLAKLPSRIVATVKLVNR
jgi:hypothetical protein